ncbi:hypothetical protein [Mycolicibacterium sp.]|uniref:hypothetical protein n=1 Tax=Mycolicibacterium sp. TaxID=2320850 RepID=UPI0037CBAC1E
MLHPRTRDIIVEGREDARFFANFLAGVRALRDAEYHVYAVGDRVDLPAAVVIESGFEDGNRGRVLTLATIAATWADVERKCLTCIADADRAVVHDDIPESDVLLMTDFGSLECYALTPTVLAKFVLIYLGKDEPKGESLLAALIPALIAAFCARAALHLADIGYGVTDEQVKKHRFDGPEPDRSLIQRALPSGKEGQDLHALVAPVLASVRTKVSTNEPRKAIRGHDIALVLVNHLGLKNQQAHHKVIEAALMTCIERADIEAFPLFQALVERVASAGT